MKHLKQAFTLVELIVVISILAILATVAFISFSWYTSDAKNTNNKANIRTIEWALQIYHTKNNSYPDATDAFNITSSGSIYAKQWTMWRKTLWLLWVRQDTVDANTKQPYFYSLSANNQKYWLVSFQNTINSFMIWAYANDLLKQYEWNWAPIILAENNQNISSDIDVLTIPDTYEVYFDNNSYWEESNKLLKYYYHPNAISVVNFNDDKFEDILWNETTVNKKPNITEWKVWNGMLINWDGWWLEIDISRYRIWENLTFSAWIKQNSYITTEWESSNCFSNSVVMRHNAKWAYMVVSHEWEVCWYRYKFTPTWYQKTWYINPINQWTHIVFVWNWVDFKSYINGSQTWDSIPITLQEWEDPNDFWWKYLIWIEALDSYVGSRKRYFDWVIDEVSMYNTALSDAEVLELYNITK